MQKYKKLSIIFTSILLFILLAFGFAVSMEQNVQDIKKVHATAGELGNTDNSEIDKYIKNIWGIYKKPNIITQPNNIMGEINGWGPGDHWGFLYEDVAQVSNLTLHYMGGRATNTRIILNGYSLSGNVYANIQGDAAFQKITFVDRVPYENGNIDLNRVQYNPNPDKYYKYDSSTGRYSGYQTSRPTNMIEVTEMPTFQANTYIHVRGSAISPNGRSSTCSTSLRTTGSHAMIEMYDVHIVGATIDSTVGLLTAAENSLFYLYRCTVIGNSCGFYMPVGILSGSNTIFALVGTKVYGNKSTSTSYGINPAYPGAPNYSNDICSLNGVGTLRVYKSNIGAISYYTNSSNYTQAIYVKDVYWSDYNNTIENATPNNYLDAIKNKTVFNTVELVYDVDPVQASGSIERVIVHGGSKTTVPKRGSITFTNNNATINELKVIHDESSSNSSIINQSGATIKDVSAGATPININGGTVTVPYNKSAKTVAVKGGTLNVDGVVDTVSSLTSGTTLNINEYGEVKNVTKNEATITVKRNAKLGTVAENAANATISLAGTLTTLTKNLGKLQIKQGGSYTIAKGETFNTGTLENLGNLTIAGTVTVDIENTAFGTINLEEDTSYEIKTGKTSKGYINNKGTLIVSGTVDRLISNTGTVDIKSGASVTVTSTATVAGTIQNAGTLTMRGTSTAALTNTGTVDLSGTLSNLVESTGTINIKAGGVYTVALGQTVGGTLNNEGTLNLGGTVTNLASNTGTLNILEGNVYTINSNNTLGGTINNAGTLNLATAITNLNSNTGILNIQNGVTLTFAQYKEYYGTINNAGTLVLNGYIDNLATNTGTVTVNATGELGVPSGVNLQGTIDNKGVVNLAGQINDLTNTGTLNILNSAVLNVQQGKTVGGIVKNEGTLNIEGTVENLTNFGLVNYIDGTVTTFTENRGTFNIAKNITYTIETGKTLGGTIDNQGTLILKGAVDTVINRGILQFEAGATIVDLTNTDIGTMNIEQGASFTLPANKVLSGIVNNKGELTVNGVIELINESTGTIIVGENGIINNLKTLSNVLTINANGTAVVENVETTATVQNNGVLGLSNTFDITKIDNNGTINLLSGVNYHLVDGQTISGIVNNFGTLTISGTINELKTLSGETIIQDNATILALHMQGGIVRLNTNTANLPQNLLVGVGTTFYVEKGITLNTFTNSGTANVLGTVTSITNNAGGVLNIEAGAKVDKIESSGETNIKAEAAVSRIAVQAGYTKIFNNSVVNTIDLLKAGTLEIQSDASLIVLNRQFGHGKLIDHRGATSLQVLLWIIGVVALLIVIAIIIMVVISKKRGNAKFKKLSKHRALSNVRAGRKDKTAQSIIDRVNQRATAVVTNNATTDTIVDTNNDNNAE